MEEPRKSRDRKRFVAALAVYLVWVAALGALAALSGHRPAPRAPAIEGR
jgi:hypothetical protein